MKAGTTALYKYLLHHPRIVPALTKEIRYFNRDVVDSEWYRAHFPTGFSPAIYRTGEASPVYIEVDTQERIRAEFPEMKLIVIMRDPVRRAISHYHHNVKRFRITDSISSRLLRNIDQFESLRDLSRDEASDTLREFYDHSVNRFLGLGLYELMLHRWLKFFPREQFFLTSLERLSAEPEAVMDELYHFLDLPPVRGQSYGVELAGNYRKDIRYDFEPRLEALYAPTVECMRETYGVEFSCSA
jgi:hypothetical protein